MVGDNVELKDVLLQIAQDSAKAQQPTDLRIGTVVAVSPLQIQTLNSMAPLQEPILYLTSAVIEKKIPILEHSHTIDNLAHSHTVSGLGHTHDVTVQGEAGELQGTAETALSGSYGTSTALSGGSGSTDSAQVNYFCYENGQPLPIENGYMIINRALQVGDKVLLLRVQNGQKYIILSRIFEVMN